MNRPLLFCLVVSFLSSCANIVTPEGGKRDNEPPRLRKTVPNNNATLYSEKFIELLFNEPIKLVANSSLVINPIQTKLPVIEVTGKSLKILFIDSLKSNTTYSISLPNMVSDITEGNTAQDIHLSFSTGSTIDTNSIRGLVLELKNSQPKSRVAVFLSSPSEDSAVHKGDVLYETITDEKGQFIFRNIRSGIYRLTCLQDENNDNKPQPDELFGFSAEHVTIPGSSIKTIYLYQDQSFTPSHLKDFKSQHYGVFEFVVSPKGCKTQLTENNLWTEEAYLLHFEGIEDDTIVWFSPHADLQDGHFDLRLNEQWYVDLTTLHMNNNHILRPLRINNRTTPGALLLTDTIAIDFSNPISYYDDRSFTLFEDTTKIIFNASGHFNNNEQSHYRFLAPLKPAKRYKLIINPGSFRDVFNQLNDSFVYRFSTSSETSYEDLTINLLNTKHERLLIQLLNADNNPLRTALINNSETIQFKGVVPGEYRIRIIKDRIKNKEWDNGLFTTNTEPEPAQLLPIKIRLLPGMAVEEIRLNADELGW